MLGLAFVEPSTNCPNRKRDETTANNAGRSARPHPVPGPGPGERSENRQRRMRHPPCPQCASSTRPDAAHRRVRSMLGPSLFGPRLTAEMFPVLLRAIQSFHLDRSTRSTAPINGRASVLAQCSGTTRGSDDTSRLPDRSGLYPPPPPKIVTGGGRQSPRTPHPARRCEICLRRRNTLVLYPPPPFLASAFVS